ncbi:hypothetical protein V6N13_055162 [Hibiscus sabdariffa]
MPHIPDPILLVEIAYVQWFLHVEVYVKQNIAGKVGDAPLDFRHAFVHALKTVSKDGNKGSRRYGVIECDPLVRKGLVKTV